MGENNTATALKCCGVKKDTYTLSMNVYTTRNTYKTFVLWQHLKTHFFKTTYIHYELFAKMVCIGKMTADKMSRAHSSNSNIGSVASKLVKIYHGNSTTGFPAAHLWLSGDS